VTEFKVVLLSEKDIKELLNLLPDPHKIRSQERADYINELAERLSSRLR